MSDLISRSALLEEFAGSGFVLESIVRHCIEKAPAVDAVSLGVYEQVKWERDVAIGQLNQLGCGFGMELSAMLENVLRKANAEPVRHGRWDERETEKPPILRCVMCSECGTMYQRRHKAYLSYCPNCGAKMTGEKARDLKPCDSCEHYEWDMPQCKECNPENGFKWHKRR